jgi:hypothetical protein
MMDEVILFDAPVPVRWVAFCRSGAGGARDQLVMDYAALVLADGERCPASLPPPAKVRSGNLEAYFSFDEGNAVDESGNRRHGAWEGTETYGAGQSGRAASFDGASRIVVHDFEGFEWGRHFSVSIFFKRTGGLGNYQGIVPSLGFGPSEAVSGGACLFLYTHRNFRYTKDFWGPPHNILGGPNRERRYCEQWVLQQQLV